MSGAKALPQVEEKLKEALAVVQSTIESQQSRSLKDRRCGKCSKFLCKSDGPTEIVCRNCGHRNTYDTT